MNGVVAGAGPLDTGPKSMIAWHREKILARAVAGVVVRFNVHGSAGRVTRPFLYSEAPCKRGLFFLRVPHLNKTRVFRCA